MRWGRSPQPVRRLALFVLGPCLLTFGALGCSNAGQPTPSPGSGPAAEVVTITNARRAEAGCGRVTSQSQLTRAAQLHAEDMAANRYFSHTGLDGRLPWDRAADQGFTGRGIGENIAQGYPTASSVMTGWMNSSGHRANIENCSYRYIGVGYHAGTKTWVQLYGT
jgi:uncharacterized protein YkwD